MPSRFLSIALLALLSGCDRGMPVAGTALPNSALPSTHAKAGTYVYVVNNSPLGTGVYAPRSTTLLRIDHSGGNAIAFDASGDAYVSGNGLLGIYKRGTATLLRSLQVGDTIAQIDRLAFDSHGNLYVSAQSDTSASYAGSISVVAPGGTTPARKIATGIDRPVAIAIDTSGNLYVANNAANNVAIYAAGGDAPVRTISTGIKNPSALLFDGKGNLYVANQGTWTGTKYTSSTVAVYAPGASSPAQTITSRINAPDALTFDKTGTLYVANRPLYLGNGNGSVTEYRAGVFVRAIAKGINKPTGLAIDASGNLYVSNARGLTTGSVTVYAPGAATPSRTLTTLILYPYAVGLSNR